MTVWLSGGKDKKPSPIKSGPPCAACKVENTPVVLLLIDEIEVPVCAPRFLAECSLRYRMGMSPSDYQRYLKATEVLSLAR